MLIYHCLFDYSYFVSSSPEPFFDAPRSSASDRTIHRILGKPGYPQLFDPYRNGGATAGYNPHRDRAPGWRAREKEGLKKYQQRFEESEKIYAEKEEMKRRDDLERILRDRREREGRVVSLIVPIEGGGEGLRAAHAGAGRTPAKEGRLAAQHGWEISTRPEYRVELDASSSIQQATRPYELEANSPAQQSRSNTHSGQRPIR